jgi:predicted acyl esterase
MFSKQWTTSRRQYQIRHHRNVAIPVRAGFTLDADIIQPDSPGRFPVILCLFPFDKAIQVRSYKPAAISPELVAAEGGDFNFYVCRGYVQAFVTTSLFSSNRRNRMER